MFKISSTSNHCQLQPQRTNYSGILIKSQYLQLQERKYRLPNFVIVPRLCNLNLGCYLYQDIAKQFNTFFANIGPDLSRKIPEHQHKNMESYLKETSYVLLTLS